MKISVIIPTLNEADSIEVTLGALQDLRTRHHEIILVDGGSNDATTERAQPLADKIIHAPRGRAMQMNAGARHAAGDVYWFLHGDTLAPALADSFISAVIASGRRWGRFNIRLSGRHILFRIIEWMMNIRSCISGIATGDQGIFMTRNSFHELGGFKPIALMEDVDISRRLKNIFGRPACVRRRLITSSRRWEQHGIIRTMMLMWSLRLAYFLGASPGWLAQRYTKH